MYSHGHMKEHCLEQCIAHLHSSFSCAFHEFGCILVKPLYSTTSLTHYFPSVMVVVINDISVLSDLKLVGALYIRKIYRECMIYFSMLAISNCT